MADTLTDQEIKDEIAPDQFEAMFLQEATGVKAENTDAEEAADATKQAEEAKAAEEAKQAEEAKAAEEAKQAEEAKAAEAKAAEDLKAAQEAQSREDAAAKAAAKAAKAAEEARQAEARAAEAAKADFTDDEKKLFESVAEDFPEITKVLEAQKRVLTEQFNAQLKTTVAEIRGELAPVYANAQEAAQAKHQAAVLKEHPDALELLPEAEKWIAAQPAYLQPAYNKVLDEGSVADVVAFFTQYKAAVGKAAPAAPVVDAAAEAEKARKLALQEGVSTRRGGDKRTGGPLGFEEAFGSIQ